MTFWWISLTESSTCTRLELQVRNKLQRSASWRRNKEAISINKQRVSRIFIKTKLWERSKKWARKPILKQTKHSSSNKLKGITFQRDFRGKTCHCHCRTETPYRDLPCQYWKSLNRASWFLRKWLPLMSGLKRFLSPWVWNFLIKKSKAARV